jgi:aminopeptidase 2
MGDVFEGSLHEMLQDKTQERLTLKFPESWNVPPGCQLALRITWKAELSGSTKGYYRCPWKKDGKLAHYALTHFAPIAVRKAFPCWDEPAFKSTYSVALVSRSGMVNLSNMPAVQERSWTGSIKLGGEILGQGLSEGLSEEWVVTQFQKTPLISSYLVAWATGEFSHLESEYRSPLTGRTVPLRVYATRDNINQARLALGVKSDAMRIYEGLFQIPYSLPKLDTLVASSFDAGGMENWGLITGRTACFLWDSKKSSLYLKHFVIRMQAHECAHMWFGNLVSPQWWTYLWLNEGFATWMGSVVIPERIFPEYNYRRDFLTDRVTRALTLDGLRSSHPVEVVCPDGNDASQLLDSISYSKVRVMRSACEESSNICARQGAAVLRVLSAVVGEDVFMKGVSIYLKSRLYGNAVSQDLWTALEQASGLDVGRMMKEWTITELGDGKVTIRQNRFFSTGDVKPEEDETLWYVPLEIKTISSCGIVSVDHKAILTEREAVFDIGSALAFKVNAETVGLYRVAYSSDRLRKVGSEASRKDSRFTVEDRIGLVSDAVMLAAAGYSKTRDALDLILRLSAEEEHQVWESIASGLSLLVQVWWEQPQDIRDGLNKLRIHLFKPVAERLGWEFKKDEDPATVELRSLALKTLANSNDGDTVSEMKRRFRAFASSGDESAIPTEIRGIIYQVAVRHSGEAEYREMRWLHDTATDSVARLQALNALGSTKSEVFIQETLRMTKDGSVLEQDVK